MISSASSPQSTGEHLRLQNGYSRELCSSHDTFEVSRDHPNGSKIMQRVLICRRRWRIVCSVIPQRYRRSHRFKCSRSDNREDLDRNDAALHHYSLRARNVPFCSSACNVAICAIEQARAAMSLAAAAATFRRALHRSDLQVSVQKSWRP